MTKRKGTLLAIITSLALTLAVLFAVFDFSDGVREQNGEDVILASDEVEMLVIDKDTTDAYKFIFSAGDSTQADADLAKELSSMFVELGLAFRYSADSTAEGEFEVLLGSTNRQLSKDLLADIEAALPEGGLAWGVAERDGKIAYTASSSAAFTRGLEDFRAFITEDGIEIPKGTWIIASLTAEEYEAELKAEQDRIEAEKEAAKQARIEWLKNEIASFDDALFGERTPMDTERYADPLTYPTAGQHPRLNLTADMLPEIQEILDDPTYKKMASNFWALANTEFDGILDAPAAEKSNYNGQHHAIIEAKALAYLLTGDELYGYEAIYAAKNYMLTIVIRHNLAGDIFRGWGRIMTVMGEVYDWCYDLMTEKDKAQFIAGVEWKLCRDCTCGSGDKMTIGYPPTGQNAIQGHGTNVALMRDYLGFAIAVFDEYPDWWELIGGRFYEEYVPANNVFYAAGMNHQGTNNYVWGKFYAQLHSAWLIKVMSGEMPYDGGIEDVVYGLMGMKLPNGRYFQGGDGGTSGKGAAGRTTHLAVAAALFPSAILKYQAYV